MNIPDDFTDSFLVPPNTKVDLKDRPTRVEGPFEDKEAGKAYLAERLVRMRELQYRLFVERKQSLLIVLQAPDAAGKDGLIRKVLGQMNPQGVSTHPFKVPTELEASHDFLWRVHRETPAAGKIAIFNRSHYEDVLVVRVEDLVPKSLWSRHYEHINAFESLLADQNTRILKFYLHISPEEQLERFGERLHRPEKHWKLNAGDYRARRKWSQYRSAYEDAMHRCSPDHAPWYVIPADRKWFRNAAVANIVCQTLESMDPQFPPVDADLDEIQQLYDEETRRD